MTTHRITLEIVITDPLRYHRWVQSQQASGKLLPVEHPDVAVVISSAIPPDAGIEIAQAESRQLE